MEFEFDACEKCLSQVEEYFYYGDTTLCKKCYVGKVEEDHSEGNQFGIERRHGSSVVLVCKSSEGSKNLRRLRAMTKTLEDEGLSDVVPKILKSSFGQIGDNPLKKILRITQEKYQPMTEVLQKESAKAVFLKIASLVSKLHSKGYTVGNFSYDSFGFIGDNALITECHSVSDNCDSYGNFYESHNKINCDLTYAPPDYESFKVSNKRTDLESLVFLYLHSLGKLNAKKLRSNPKKYKKELLATLGVPSSDYVNIFKAFLAITESTVIDSL